MVAAFAIFLFKYNNSRTFAVRELLYFHASCMTVGGHQSNVRFPHTISSTKPNSNSKDSPSWGFDAER